MQKIQDAELFLCILYFFIDYAGLQRMNKEAIVSL